MSAPVFFALGLPVTAYALGFAASLLLSSLLMMRGLKRAGYAPAAGETFLLAAVPLGLLLSRLFYVLIRLDFFLGWGGNLAFRLWQGGFSFWGLPLALLLALLAAARLNRASPARLADSVIPYALLLLALGRLCEGLAGQGFGREAGPALAFFPFSVVNEYGEWRYAVFLLESLGALLILLLVNRARGGQEGDRARLALVLYCACQLVFESLRQDEVLAWGFVRASQFFSALALLLMMVSGLYRGRRNAWRAPAHLALALFFLLILLVAGLEYAIDKTGLSLGLIYALMALAAAGLGLLGTRAATGMGADTAGRRAGAAAP